MQVSCHRKEMEIGPPALNRTTDFNTVAISRGDYKADLKQTRCATVVDYKTGSS